jgi:hypothetical protein
MTFRSGDIHYCHNLLDSKVWFKGSNWHRIKGPAILPPHTEYPYVNDYKNNKYWWYEYGNCSKL